MLQLQEMTFNERVTANKRTQTQPIPLQPFEKQQV